MHPMKTGLTHTLSYTPLPTRMQNQNTQAHVQHKHAYNSKHPDTNVLIWLGTSDKYARQLSHIFFICCLQTLWLQL